MTMTMTKPSRKARAIHATGDNLVVLVAKEVLCMLDQKSFIPIYDSYLCSDGGQCEACALGAMFMGLARLRPAVRTDSMILGQLSYDCGVMQNLLGGRQMTMIENAFMLWNQGEAGHDFGSRFLFVEDRTRAIMTNIIENNGRFRP